MKLQACICKHSPEIDRPSSGEARVDESGLVTQFTAEMIFQGSAESVFSLDTHSFREGIAEH